MISIRGKEPIHIQIEQRIINYIAMGVYKPDEQLPSVRNLAEELCVNPNTVQKAYSNLEAKGYVYTLYKKGVFVKNTANKEIEYRVCFEMIKKIKDMGFSKEELLKMILEIYDDRD